MIFETEIPQARSPSCSLKLDSIQTHSIPRVWMISLWIRVKQSVTTPGRNFEIAWLHLYSRVSGVFVFTFRKSLVVSCGQAETMHGHHWFSASFVAPHSTENKRNPFCRVRHFRKQFQKVLQLSKCRFASPKWKLSVSIFSPETNIGPKIPNYERVWTFIERVEALAGLRHF